MPVISTCPTMWIIGSDERGVPVLNAYKKLPTEGELFCMAERVGRRRAVAAYSSRKCYALAIKICLSPKRLHSLRESRIFPTPPFGRHGFSPTRLPHKKAPHGRGAFCMAERVGFEPTAPCGVTGFQDQLLKPLGHLSVFAVYNLKRSYFSILCDGCQVVLGCVLAGFLQKSKKILKHYCIFEKLMLQ